MCRLLDFGLSIRWDRFPADVATNRCSVQLLGFDRRTHRCTVSVERHAIFTKYSCLKRPTSITSLLATLNQGRLPWTAYPTQRAQFWAVCQLVPVNLILSSLLAALSRNETTALAVRGLHFCRHHCYRCYCCPLGKCRKWLPVYFFFSPTHFLHNRGVFAFPARSTSCGWPFQCHFRSCHHFVMWSLDTQWVASGLSLRLSFSIALSFFLAEVGAGGGLEMWVNVVLGGFILK